MNIRIDVWVCGVWGELFISCHSPLSVVQATFEKTDYIVSEGSGRSEVCVVLSISAVRNVTVMVTGGEIVQCLIRRHLSIFKGHLLFPRKSILACNLEGMWLLY